MQSLEVSNQWSWNLNTGRSIPEHILLIPCHYCLLHCYFSTPFPNTGYKIHCSKLMGIDIGWMISYDQETQMT